MKAARPGFEAEFNGADPNNARPITQANVLAKLVELVLADRLTHWSAVHGLISPAQVGFRQQRGAEWHVWTLREAIRARLRHRKATYVLFVDIQKAYDRVHQGALWVVLRHMGVPDRIVRLLETWGSRRTTSVMVNGSLGEPFPMEAGVPQGSVLSPLLFNLYIESLSRYLASLPEYEGVRVLNTVLRHLLYADDLSAPARSPRQLEIVLEAIGRWGEAWGLRLGVGNGKTEAMAFGRPAPAQPLYGGGYTVPWTALYRYLGYMLRGDLSEDHIVGALRRALSFAAMRFFYANRMVAGLSSATQLQLLKSCVIGQVLYLRSVVYLTPAQCAALDKVVLDVARRATQAYGQAPSVEIWTRSRLLSFDAICSRERTRLYHQLRTTPYADDIAPRLFHELAAERRTRESASAAGNWVHHVERLRRSAGRLGPVYLAPRGYFDIPRVSAVYGRSLGFARFRRAARATAARLAIAADGPALTTVPGTHPLAHVGYLHRYYDTLPSALGERQYSTPLSVQGPGALGSIIALTTLPPSRSSYLAKARFGRRGLYAPPFYVAPRRSREGWQRFHREANRVQPCTLCRRGVETMWHLVFECRHRRVAAARRRLATAAPTAVRRLTRALAAAISAGAVNVAPLVATVEHALLATLESFAWDSAEGRAVTYNLLMASTWSPDHTPPHWHVGRLLGHLFELANIEPSHLRRLAGLWVEWADEEWRRLAEARIPTRFRGE
jgi:hypothetical protein